MISHNFDPVIIDFGLLEIRWYSLSYILGIVLGWWYGKKLLRIQLNNNIKKFDLDNFDDLIGYIIIGIIFGGRLGYIIFYNPTRIIIKIIMSKLKFCNFLFVNIIFINILWNIF